METKKCYYCDNDAIKGEMHCVDCKKKVIEMMSIIGRDA